MNIYQLKHLDNYEILFLKNDQDYFRLRELKENEIFSFTGKQNYGFSAVDNEHKKLKTEFPNFENSNYFLMKANAFDCFHQELLPYGVFFKVQSENEEDIYFFRPTIRYDILNVEKSKILMFDPIKDKGYLRKAVLHDTDFEELLIFKVKQSFSPIFVNQRFVDIYKEKGFQGLYFEKIEIV